MESIFVSHSREDKNKAFFSKAFANTKVNPIMMEFEEYENPPADAIKRRVREAKAVLVLLSTHVFQRGHVTSNWISFEVGIAYALGKPVWLFEPIREPFFGQYDFPIPHCTHHVVYDPDDSSSKNLNAVRDVILGLRCPETFQEEINCPECRLSYMVVGLTHPFKSTDCPNCKTMFTIDPL